MTLTVTDPFTFFRLMILSVTFCDPVHCPTFCFSDNEFLHVPHDATIFDGETLTLDCLHQFGQSYTWRANDTVLNSQDDKADIVRDGLQLRYGPVDYRDNSLLIYCVAHLNNGRQFVSPPGRLEVIGEFMLYSISIHVADISPSLYQDLLILYTDDR